MNKGRMLVAACAGAVLFGLAGGASAQDNWYAAFSLGSSNAEMDGSAVEAAGATASSLNADERDPGYKVLVGYRINPHFAVEGGYAHLGEFRTTRNVTAPTVGAINADIRIKGLIADLVGTYPVSSGVSVYGKLGALLSETKVFRATSGTVTPVRDVGQSTDQINAKIGLGLQYELDRRSALRVEWEHFRNVGKRETTGQTDIDLYSVGFAFRF